MVDRDSLSCLASSVLCSLCALLPPTNEAKRIRVLRVRNMDTGPRKVAIVIGFPEFPASAQPPTDSRAPSMAMMPRQIVYLINDLLKSYKPRGSMPLKKLELMGIFNLLQNSTIFDKITI